MKTKFMTRWIKELALLVIICRPLLTASIIYCSTIDWITNATKVSERLSSNSLSIMYNSLNFNHNFSCFPLVQPSAHAPKYKAWVQGVKDTSLSLVDPCFHWYILAQYLHFHTKFYCNNIDILYQKYLHYLPSITSSSQSIVSLNLFRIQHDL